MDFFLTTGSIPGYNHNRLDLTLGDLSFHLIPDFFYRGLPWGFPEGHIGYANTFLQRPNEGYRSQPIFPFFSWAVSPIPPRGGYKPPGTPELLFPARTGGPVKLIMQVPKGM